MRLASLRGQGEWLDALEALARSDPLAVAGAAQEAWAAVREAAAALGGGVAVGTPAADLPAPPLLARIVARLRLSDAASPVAALLRSELGGGARLQGGGPDVRTLAASVLAHVPPAR